MGKNIGFLLLLICLHTDAWTQVLQGIGKQIEKGASEKASDFNSTRSNKEKSINSKSRTNPSVAPSAPAPASEPAKSESPAPVETPADAKAPEDSYLFSQKMTYRTQNLITQKEPVLMTYRCANSAILLSVDKAEMITDLDNQLLITLMSEQKAVVMPLDKLKQSQKQPATEERPVVVQTGRKKKILGYNCEEYLLKYKDGSQMELWTTKEISLGTDHAKMLTGLAGLLPGGKSDYDNVWTNSLLMEMTSTNAAGQKESHMLMTEYKTENFPVVMSDYEITNR